MVSANIKANGMNIVLDTALWAGQGGITKLNEDGLLTSQGDVSWLQSPVGTGTPMSTIRMAVIDITLATTNTLMVYDIAEAVLETGSNTPNPLYDPNSAVELVSVYPAFNLDSPNGHPAQGEHKQTQIKIAANANATANDRIRVTFLYRRAL